MAVSPFGPFAYPTQFSPWGISPHAVQGLGLNPYAFQQYTQNQPLTSAPLSSPITSPAVGLQQLQQQLQQVFPVLQIVPQQLQHLQQLMSVQLQELQQLQQIVQQVPAQLQQLHQLIQLVPQQLQQPSPFQQPFGQSAGAGSFAATPPWGIAPHHAFGAQPNQVM